MKQTRKRQSVAWILLSIILSMLLFSSFQLRPFHTIRLHPTQSVHLALNNIFDRSYQNHLSRLKYIGTNPLTGERGICDMGRNFTVRLIVPIL